MILKAIIQLFNFEYVIKISIFVGQILGPYLPADLSAEGGQAGFKG